MVSTFLVWGLAVRMEFIHALIACVCEQFDTRGQRQASVLEKSKFVSFAETDGDAQNLLLQVVNHDLSFLGMAFFLAGVALALFFWGRSTRCSLASTTITVRPKEPSCKAFLPGK